MPEASTRVGEQRPGGRSARVRNAILDATSDLLDQVGYSGVTIDEVAMRAGVHKTTVYRRWPTKPELIAAAVGARAEVDVPIPDTGTLVGDMRALAAAVVDNIGSGPGAQRSRSIVAAAAASPELTANLHSFWADRMNASGVVIERAVTRGELRADIDPNLIIETLVGPIWLRLLLTGEPIDSDLADRLAELVTAGAIAAGGSTERG